jgi:hypothetical protein
MTSLLRLIKLLLPRNSTGVRFQVQLHCRPVSRDLAGQFHKCGNDWSSCRAGLISELIISFEFLTIRFTILPPVHSSSITHTSVKYHRVGIP